MELSASSNRTSTAAKVKEGIFRAHKDYSYSKPELYRYNSTKQSVKIYSVVALFTTILYTLGGFGFGPVFFAIAVFMTIVLVVLGISETFKIDPFKSQYGEVPVSRYHEKMLENSALNSAVGSLLISEKVSSFQKTFFEGNVAYKFVRAAENAERFDKDIRDEVIETLRETILCPPSNYEEEAEVIKWVNDLNSDLSQLANKSTHSNKPAKAKRDRISQIVKDEIAVVKEIDHARELAIREIEARDGENYRF